MFCFSEKTNENTAGIICNTMRKKMAQTVRKMSFSGEFTGPTKKNTIKEHLFEKYLFFLTLLTLLTYFFLLENQVSIIKMR